MARVDGGGQLSLGTRNRDTRRKEIQQTLRAQTAALERKKKHIPLQDRLYQAGMKLKKGAFIFGAEYGRGFAVCRQRGIQRTSRRMVSCCLMSTTRPRSAPQAIGCCLCQQPHVPSWRGLRAWNMR